MSLSHIRDDILSKQASKKTDFTVDLIIMVGLAKACPNKQSGCMIFRTVRLIYVLRVEFGLPLALLLSIVTKLFLYPNQIENVCWPCKAAGAVTLIIQDIIVIFSCKYCPHAN